MSDSFEPPKPSDGWELLCEGILRTEFGRRPSDALTNAVAQLAAEGVAESVGDSPPAEVLSPPLRLHRRELAPAPTELRSAGLSPGRTRPAGRPAQVGWLKRMMPRVIWREIHISLRWALGGLGAACLLLLGLHSYFDNTPVARIAELRGQATVERHGKEIDVQIGHALYPSDILRVPPGGGMVLALNAGATRVGLEAGTEFRILGHMRGKKFMLQRGKLQATVAPQPQWRPMTLSTPHAEATVLGTRFSLEASSAATRLEVVEGTVALRKKRLVSTPEKDTVAVHAGHFAIASPATAMEERFITGYATPEVLAFPAATTLFGTADGTVIWSGNISNLVSFPGAASMEESGATRYEQRIRCYIIPPTTGDYTFWINSGKRSELWLSPDDEPAHRQKIASMPLSPKPGPGLTLREDAFQVKIAPATSLTNTGDASRSTILWTGYFNEYPSQKSSRQHLVAGTRCYLEVRHELDPKAMVNPLSLGWSKPGEPNRVPSSGAPGGTALAPFFDPSQYAVTLKGR